MSAAARTAVRGRGGRARMMSLLALRMMFHDRSKLIGTLLGVVFAVVLANQQLGTFAGLLYKNTMFVDNAGVDVWIVPPGMEQLTGGDPISISALTRARATPGVAWAEPLAYGTGTVARPDGGTEAVSIVGARAPRFAGGPWNLVSGSTDALLMPDTMIFEDSRRGAEFLGAMNVGSMREISGHRVVAGGFVWGLLPFGPSYAFAEYDLAREILHLDADQTSFVLVRAAPGHSPEEVRDAIRARIPELRVLTSQEFHDSTVEFILTRTAIGVTFGTSTIFGLIVGFVIVALSMFSSVVDNVREFGTLKAMGATTLDLAKLLFVQAVTYSAIGSTIGLFLVTRMAEGIRSPQLALVLPPVMYGGTYVAMAALCMAASMLALWRIRNIEPGMVFR